MIRYWRVAFYLALAVGAQTLAWFWRTSAERTDAARMAYVGVWLGAAAVYVALVWATRRKAARAPFFDIATVGVLLFTAYFEANWPGTLPNVTPDLFAGVWGAVAAMGYRHEIRRTRDLAPAR